MAFDALGGTGSTARFRGTATATPGGGAIYTGTNTGAFDGSIQSTWTASGTMDLSVTLTLLGPCARNVESMCTFGTKTLHFPGMQPGQ